MLFLQNYRLNLINMYELEHVEASQRRLIYILRLLKKDQRREEIYQEVQEDPACRKLNRETGRAMAVLLRDEKLGQYIEERKEKGETFSMCKALDDMSGPMQRIRPLTLTQELAQEIRLRDLLPRVLHDEIFRIPGSQDQPPQPVQRASFNTDLRPGDLRDRLAFSF